MLNINGYSISAMDKNNINNGFIKPHGGYRKLLSFQKAEIIYDATIYFTNRFFSKYDRTASQMVQAARSGKQNIAEGSMASATSKETEIKLTNVARASLEELKIDYEDFLRTNKLPVWDINHILTQRLREINRSTLNTTYNTFIKAIEHENPEICANTVISLIKTTSHLLKLQINQLEVSFLNEGGLRESMYKARMGLKNKKEV